MRVEFSGNQFQVDGGGWFNNSPTLSLALASLLNLVVTAYEAEAPDANRLADFQGRDFIISLLILNPDSVEFEVAAIVSESGDPVEISAVRAVRQHSEVSTQFLDLIETIAGEIQP